MKCAFDHCKKTACTHLFGSVNLGRSKITFPVCQIHWKVIVKMQAKFNKEKKIEQHYSVAELEKIIDSVYDAELGFLIATLKDKKKVQEILNEK